MYVNLASHVSHRISSRLRQLRTTRSHQRVWSAVIDCSSPLTRAPSRFALVTSAAVAARCSLPNHTTRRHNQQLSDQRTRENIRLRNRKIYSITSNGTCTREFLADTLHGGRAPITGCAGFPFPSSPILLLLPLRKSPEQEEQQQRSVSYYTA